MIFRNQIIERLFINGEQTATEKVPHFQVSPSLTKTEFETHKWKSEMEAEASAELIYRKPNGKGSDTMSHMSTDIALSASNKTRTLAEISNEIF